MTPQAKVDAENLDKILELLVDGKSQREIEAETKLSRKFIAKVLRTPEVQAMIKTQAKLVVSKRVGEAVKMLYQLVNDGNMDAVKTVFKIVGAMDPETVTAQKNDQSLTIILPGAPSAKVEKEVVIDQSSGDESNQDF